MRYAVLSPVTDMCISVIIARITVESDGIHLVCLVKLIGQADPLAHIVETTLIPSCCLVVRKWIIIHRPPCGGCIRVKRAGCHCAGSAS